MVKSFNARQWISAMHKRPKMFVGEADDGEIHTFLIHLEFIRAIFKGFCFSLPVQVKLSSFYEHHVLTAIGCQALIEDILDTDIPENFGQHNSFIDWMMSVVVNWPKEKPEVLTPLAQIIYLVYMSEFCLVDITTAKEHFRQTFYKGEAITPCLRKSVTNSEDFFYIRLSLTPIAEIFNTRYVLPKHIKQIEKSIERYKKQTGLTNLSFELNKQMPYEFEMTISSPETYESISDS